MIFRAKNINISAKYCDVMNDFQLAVLCTQDQWRVNVITGAV
jgi:hypothetical protein